MKRLHVGILWLALSACGGGGHSSPEQTDKPPPTVQPATVDEGTLRVLNSLRYNEHEAPPADPSNRVAEDPMAAHFGQTLFFDPRLSGPLIDGDNDGGPHALGNAGEAGRVSCAGCHIPESGFVDTRSLGQKISLGSRWILRRTPSLLEVGFVPLLNWDGRRDAHWNQALGVFESDREFNSARLFVATQVFEHHRDDYTALFGPLDELADTERFPRLSPEEAGCQLLPRGELQCRGKPGDGAEYDAMAEEDQQRVTRVATDVGKALGAYVSQLRCGPGRFDQWLDGDADAMTASEVRGAQLFVSAGCAECHSGPRLTDDAFHNVGLAPERVAVVFVALDDKGAAEGVAQAMADPLNTRGVYSDADPARLPDHIPSQWLGAFRTPSLRCVSSRPSFMRTGQFSSLEQVVAFFNRGGDPTGYPGESVLQPLGLSDQEQMDLVNFLSALDGPGPDAELLTPP